MPGMLGACQGDVMRFSVIAIAAALVLSPAWAQEPPAAAPAAEAAATLQLELTDTLSTKTTKRGDMFNLRLAAPAVVDGQTVAAGTTAMGEVVESRPGTLILSARYLDLDGKHVPISAPAVVVERPPYRQLKPSALGVEDTYTDIYEPLDV